MCGIAAIISSSDQDNSAAIGRMVDELRHRGPDAQGITKLNGADLGHRRLSIIDLAGGAQPMSDSSGRYWITFNGEIFNFRELRQELEFRGAAFRTASDTEVLLAAWLEFGDQTPLKLNGQFAFAIWDSHARRLFAARDRFGEKPLYWAVGPDGSLLLASEIKAILAAGILSPRLDRLSVDTYLSLLYVPPDRTIYSNVNTLRPAHAMTWSDGVVRQWCYWRPAFSTTSLSLEEAAHRGRELLERAVERQMVADVPVGAFLSGGLDSSTIVALMSRHARQPIKTFSVGFGELINELPFADAVARQYKTDHHQIQMNIDVAEMLEKMAVVYDEPFADSSNIPTYLLAEFSRRHVKVCLSGDGADEIFGGYEWYNVMLAATSRSRVEACGAYIIARAAGLLSRVGFPLAAHRDRLDQRHKGVSLRRRYGSLWRAHLGQMMVDDELRGRLWGGGEAARSREAMIEGYRPQVSEESLDAVADLDIRSYLPGDILVKVDRAAMANGLEVRAPFLDAELADFVLSLPASLRLPAGRRKELLRASCGDLWPDAVRNRRKQGFGAPIWKWIGHPEVKRQWKHVTRPNGPLLSLLPGAGRVNSVRSPQLAWTLLCLGLWLEKRPECLRP